MAREKEKMVAVIEDDESYRNAVHRLLKSAGFSVQSFASAEDFLSSGRQHETGCLITDIRMPGMSGLDLQAKLNADHCPIPAIFVTAHWDEDMRSQAMRGGAVQSGCCVKSRYGVTAIVRRSNPGYRKTPGSIPDVLDRICLLLNAIAAPKNNVPMASTWNTSCK